MTQAARKLYTPREYLALEEVATYKSEYYQGEIFQMAGGSYNHNVISSNINALLNNALDNKPCVVFSSVMRLNVRKNGLFTYPDAMVVCGTPQFFEERSDTITNPVLIVEVLSPSTETYDRKGKFTLYKAVSTIQDYVLVDQDEALVEYYHRLEPRKWLLETYEGLESVVSLNSIEVELPLQKIYRKVLFSSETAP